MAVSKDRIVVPRHFVTRTSLSRMARVVANSPKIEFQPAASPDGNLIAVHVAEDNKSEIWTAGVHGDKCDLPDSWAASHDFRQMDFRSCIRTPISSGNDDVWKIDIRNGTAERLTDADEIDIASDWSADGHSIAFASARGGAISIWTIPASGGKRLRINGRWICATLFSGFAKSILFWNRQALWIDAGRREESDRSGERRFPSRSPESGRVSGKDRNSLRNLRADCLVWPGFDMLPRWQVCSCPDRYSRDRIVGN